MFDHRIHYMVKVWALVLKIRLFPWNLGYKNAFAIASIAQKRFFSKYTCVDLRWEPIETTEIKSWILRKWHLIENQSGYFEFRVIEAIGNRLVSIDLERNLSTLSLGTVVLGILWIRCFQMKLNCDLFKSQMKTNRDPKIDNTSSLWHLNDQMWCTETKSCE